MTIIDQTSVLFTYKKKKTDHTFSKPNESQGSRTQSVRPMADQTSGFHEGGETKSVNMFDGGPGLICALLARLKIVEKRDIQASINYNASHTEIYIQ